MEAQALQVKAIAVAALSVAVDSSAQGTVVVRSLSLERQALLEAEIVS